MVVGYGVVVVGAGVVLTEIHINILHRESYMVVHGLLNLLNELGKRDKMRGLPSI